MTSRRSRRTRARALVAAAAVLAVSATAACSSAQSGAVTNSTLTVAAFNPFTGPDASFGPEMMAGCQAAATAINAAGGVLSHKVACTSVDTHGDPADAVTAAAKMLATTPHLLGVLGPSSDEADATAPLINAAKVPMFADTGEASFDHNKLPYFWRMIPADDVRGYAMALYAKQKGYLRAAAVFGNDVGSQTGVPTLLKGYSELGGQMVLNQKITLGQTSYQPEVEQLIAAKPQVIFTETSPQANATYLAELQQLGHLIPVSRHRRDDPAELVYRDGRGDRQAGAEPSTSLPSRPTPLRRGPGGRCTTRTCWPQPRCPSRRSGAPTRTR